MALGARAIRNNAIERNATAGTTLSRRSFNLLIGGLLAAGFAVLGLTSWLVMQPGIAAVIASHQLVFAIASIVFSIGGMVAIGVGGSKQNTALLAVGYAVFTLSFGAMTSLWLPHYGIDTITDAFLSTAAISVAFGLLGITFPRFFERIVGVAAAVLIGGLLASFVLALVGISPSWIDYLTVIVFSIFIGYDVHMATRVEANIFNAVMVASNIFLDIVNVFIALLDILNNE